MSSSKRIAVIGTPGRIESSYLKSTTKIFVESGKNTGNLAFWYATEGHITNEREYIGWDAEPERIREDFDLLLFPAANQVNPNLNWARAAEVIDKSKLPLVVMGLGAQANHFSDKIVLQDGTKRFLKIMSERCKTIGIRGQYTSKVLKEYGITNVSIIGCPSNLINLNSNLGLEIEHKFSNISIDMLAANFVVSPKFRNYLQFITKILQSRNGAFICQGPNELVSLCRHEFGLVGKTYFDNVRDLMMPEASASSFEKFVCDYFKSYFDTEAWINFLRGFDLSIGTRMHGNLLALQAGIPAVIISHDTRTAELASTLKVPCLEMEEFQIDIALEEIIENIEFDGAKFDENRRSLASVYCSILEDSCVDITPQLRNFAFN